ncbi:hypothetical protein [Actinoplanes auranticolor]|uniref:Uncharacterized protein n=1 Tax=Actinoplanes auranticolor TaxID=47988 RepID=A0A919SJX2_9ACTN|nr:hypothetical protein [Actinoplanes auranticolor]GIM72857.1 hypothetical protein Aau02nite_53180 [Actinoplanes auranticolor]
MIRDELTRRDVFGRYDARGDGRREDPRAGAIRPPDRVRVESAAVEEMPAFDDEPTGDVLGAGRPRGFLSRLDARTRSILAAAATAAVLVNAGAVWAYWQITGAETGRANAGTVVELNLRGRSDLNKPLTPGSTGNLTVTLTNDHDFPIRITSVSPASGSIMADDEHRENGCVNHGVTVAQDAFAVRWKVDRNHVGAFTVPGGLAMATKSDPACEGAVFTVPVLVTGVAEVS